MDMPERRRALLDEGRTLFLAQGYGATSVDEICAAAGVTKGSFFHYFASKEQFATEVLADTWQEFVSAHQGSAEWPPVEGVYRHIDFMVGFISAHGRLIPRLAQELGASHPEIRQQVQSYFKAWTEHLRELLAAAGCGEDTEAALEFVISVIEGVPVVAAQLGEQVAPNATAQLKRYIASIASSS